MRSAGILVTLLFVGASAQAGVFYDDFEDGIPNGWRIVSGDWEIVDGDLVLDSSGGANELSMIMLDSPWDITNADIDVTIGWERGALGTERPMVFFRLEDEANGYAFQYRGDEQWIGVGRLNAQTFSVIRGDAKDQIQLGDTAFINIDIDDNIFLVTYNDVAFARIGDIDEEFTVGKVGLGALNVDTPIHFEEFRVEGEGVDQFAPDLRSVDPRDKLATAWGRIKVGAN